MSENKLAGKNVLFIIAKADFRDEELFEPKRILEQLGAKAVVASSSVGLRRGMLGGTVQATMTIDEVAVGDYDAVIFIGGTGASEYLENTIAHKIAKGTVENSKVLGAICIAPSTLANAGVLTGKQATSWSSQRSHLKQQGAAVTTDPVVVDGNIVTGEGPHAAREFGTAIANLLAR